MDSFILYTSQYNSIKSLSKADKGELLDALYSFAASDGECHPKFAHPQTEMAYSFIVSRILENYAKYQHISTIRRNAGRMGGRPKRQLDEAEKTGAEKAKKANGFCEKAKKQKKPTVTDTESRSNSTSPVTSSDTLEKVADESATLQKKQKQKKAQVDSEDFQGLNFEDEAAAKGDWEKWYAAVLRLFNEAVAACQSAIRPVKVLSQSRRESLRRLASLPYKPEDYKRAFHNMAVSPYCNGRTADRRRPVDFDWLIKEHNFNRAFEGSL